MPRTSCSLAAAIATFVFPFTVLAGPLVLEEQATVPAPDPTYAWPETFALDGDWLLSVGSKDVEATNDKDHSAWLHRRQSDGSWRVVRRLVQRIVPDLSGPPFMEAAMQGGVAAVMLHSQSGFTSWIFERSGDEWVSVPSPIDSNGLDIAIDAGTIVATAGDACSSTTNAYRKGANGAWQLVRVIVDSTPVECDNKFPSGAVEVSGNAIIVSTLGEGTRIVEGPFGSPPTITKLDGGGAMAIDLPSAIVGGVETRLDSYIREAAGMWRLSGPFQQRPDDLVLGGRGVSARGGLAGVSYGTGRVVSVFQRNADGRYEWVAELVPSDRTPAGGVRISGRRMAVGGRSLRVYDLPTDLSQPATVQDTFEDGNASTWSPIAGSSFSVASTATSKVLRQSSDTGNAAAFLNDTDWQNQSIQADIRPTAYASGTGERWFGLAARYTDASNFYYVTLRRTQVVQLKKMVNGSFSTIASAPLPINLNSTYRVRLEAIGTRLRVYVNDALLLDARDTALSHGQAGVFMYRTKADYDNVVVSVNPLRTLARLAFEAEDDTFFPEQLGEWLRTLIENNTKVIYVQPSTAGDARAITGIVTDDQAVQASIRPTSMPTGGSSWFGAVTRYRDSGNFYYVTLRSSNVISLRKLVNGAIVELDSAPLPIAINNWYRVRFEALGDQLRVYVNGQLRVEATDSTHVTGRYGLATYRAAAEFDEVLVTQP